MITNFTDPNSTISEPYKIAAGSDGALWFTNYGNSSIGRITTGGVVTNYTDPSISYPYAITAGSDGALWFSNYGNDSIGRITTAGVVTSYTDPSVIDPFDITAGPDGALWFTDYYGSSSIGRITTAGVITSYTDPSVVDPYGITAGPDGALWFTNHYSSSSIGRITTDTPISCGSACVVVVTEPGQTVASSSGPPTDAHPTKQVLTLPAQAGAGAVSVKLQSINPGPKTSAADQQLCPVAGTAPRCSGQISVVAGDFKKFVSRDTPFESK